MTVAGTQDGSVVLAGTTCMPDDRDRDIWVYILDSGGKKIAEYLFGEDGEGYSSAVRNLSTILGHSTNAFSVAPPCSNSMHRRPPWMLLPPLLVRADVEG